MGRRERRVRASSGRERKEVLTVYEKALSIAVQHPEVDLKGLGNSVLKLSRKLNMRLGRPRSIFICRKCGSVLIPGRNSRFRLHRRNGISYIGIKCLSCGAYRKIVVKE